MARPGRPQLVGRPQSAIRDSRSAIFSPGRLDVDLITQLLPFLPAYLISFTILQRFYHQGPHLIYALGSPDHLNAPNTDCCLFPQTTNE